MEKSNHLIFVYCDKLVGILLNILLTYLTWTECQSCDLTFWVSFELNMTLLYTVYIYTLNISTFTR